MGVVAEDCNSCRWHCDDCPFGSGKIVRESKCDACCISWSLPGRGIFDCETCQGSGVLERSCGMRGVCFDCDGTGVSPCSLCTNGVVRTVGPCQRCHGTGIDRMKRAGCVDCGGAHVRAAPCGSCDGLGGILCTDFAKVVQKQAMCQMCAQFSPLHLMAPFGACGHMFCLPCLIR